MLNSYIEFTAFGVYCGQFVNELVNSGSRVFDISASSDIYTIKTAPRNYPAIVRAARAYRVKTRVVGRHGAYFVLRRYRRRVGIPLGVLAFFAVIVIMSGFIWSIRISGNEQIGSWQILEQLAHSGIRAGVHRDSFNANQAELELALAIDALAWVSIERTGSRLNVKVSERLPEAAGQVPADMPCDVITSRSGQLIKADVYRGELAAKIGSGINAGDVIVRGNGTHADAKLLVEVVEIVDFYQPYTVFHRARNGHSMSNRSVVFLGMRFGGERDISKHADHIDYTETLTAPRLLENIGGGFPLPVRVLQQDYAFYERVEVTDSPAAAREKLDRQIELYEHNFLQGAEIIDRQVEFSPDDNGIGAIARYVFRTDTSEKVSADSG
jgi:sporulation protein YqfD